MTNTSISAAAEEDPRSAPHMRKVTQLEALAAIADVEVPLSAELDRLRVSVRELIGWKVGQIVALSRPTGENVDLFAGDVLIGNAEILIVDEKLAVRVADLKDKTPAVHNAAPQE